jgi:hypothetical protein
MVYGQTEVIRDHMAARQVEGLQNDGPGLPYEAIE